MLRRSALALSRRVAGSKPAAKAVNTRMFTPSMARYSQNDAEPKPEKPTREVVAFEDIRTEEDLLAPGALPGTIPSDLEQSTGLERFEILGKMQGIDVFDMRPLDASRKGTLDNPIIVNSAGDEQFAGCTGYPVDSHVVIWLRLDRKRPMERCPECGGVYRMNYIGPPDDAHAHGGHGDEHHGDAHHTYEEPPTFGAFVKPEYRGGPPGFVHPT